jgi:histone H3/H4
MTVREISEIAGVSVDTVQKKIKELYPEIVEQRKRTVLNKTQAIDIMKELRKKNFILPQNSADLPQNSADSRLDRLEQLIEKLLLVTGNLLQVQQSNQTQEKRVMLPAPQLDARAHIKKMIDEYVSRNGIEHSDAYRYLYREFFYRTHCNASLCAKNRGVKTIDYIDDEGMIETLEAIAMEVL